MLGQILRWVLVVPTTVFVYVIVKMSLSFLFFLILPDSTEYYSALFIGAGVEFIGSALSVYVGVLTAPKHKKHVFVFFAVSWVVLLMFISFLLGMSFSKGKLPDETLEQLVKSVAQFVGFVVAGFVIWKEQRKVKLSERRNVNAIDM